MRTVPVHMLAFMDDRKMVRNVEIDISTSDDLGSYEGKELESVLELVFKWGQNDFQPRQCPSVSVGDVAQLGHRYFMVMPVGWGEISKDEFDSLKPPTAHYAYRFDKFDREIGI